MERKKENTALKIYIYKVYCDMTPESENSGARGDFHYETTAQ
jgi:hypothetical protein